MSDAFEKRHLRVGWWGLVVYLSLGIFLEALHAMKAPFYLDEGHETRRLMWTLAHAHGTLISIVHVLYALTIRARPEAARASASTSLIVALVLLPLGFFLGGAWARGGDPGVSAALVPAGAVVLAIGVGLVARRVG